MNSIYDEQHIIHRKTMHGAYHAIVTADEEEEKFYIELYKGKWAHNLFLTAIGFGDEEPIMDDEIEFGENVENKISKMIIKYELAIHQLEKAKNGEEFLDIDYEAELERLEAKDKDEPLLKQKKEVPLHDYEHGTKIMQITKHNDIIKPFKRKKERKTNYNEKSLSNLKQYRDKK